MRHHFQTATAKLFAYFIFLALIGSAVMQIPALYVSGHAVPYIDGLFTTVSALCVTGLSTVDMRVYTDAGFAAILTFIELGGLGLVTFFIVYLAFPSKHISLANRNFIRDFFISDVAVNVRQILVRIVTVTLLIQTAGAGMLACLLKQAGESRYVFYGIFLSVSAFCNAGFAPYSDNLERFYGNYGICIIVSLLIIAGGLGFTVLSDCSSHAVRRLRGKKPGPLSLHSRIVLLMTLVLVCAGAMLIFLCDRVHAFRNMTFPQALCSAFFQSVTLRTAGFDTVAQSSFSAQSTIIALVLMMIGGSPGSMAGGMKTTTVFLVWCYTFRGDGDRGNLSLMNRDISWETLNKAVGILMKGFFIFFISFFALTVAERFSISRQVFSFGDLVYEAVSAFATVGVSKGVTPLLSSWGKMIIILTMFAGRTGVFALSIAPRGTGRKAAADFPNEEVLVG